MKTKAKRTLLVEEQEVELSSTEYKLLEVLMERPNTVLSRDELMNLARGRDFMAFDRSIDVHISKLRTKLKKYPRFRNSIKTVWGTGYMFVDAL
jgi:two-component system phosphate regulon response regulator OmpR